MDDRRLGGRKCGKVGKERLKWLVVIPLSLLSSSW